MVNAMHEKKKGCLICGRKVEEGRVRYCAKCYEAFMDKLPAENRT